MSIIIRQPDSKEEWSYYYDLRFRILRKPLGKERGSERNDGDETGIHLTLYDNGELKAITRLDQPESNIGQVRFVAVETGSHGRGYGRLIMEEAESISQQRGDQKMILQARENALEFYKKMNYSIIEKSYLLFDQIQHYLMEKEY